MYLQVRFTTGVQNAGIGEGTFLGGLLHWNIVVGQVTKNKLTKLLLNILGHILVNEYEMDSQTRQADDEKADGVIVCSL